MIKTIFIVAGIFANKTFGTWIKEKSTPVVPSYTAPGRKGVTWKGETKSPIETGVSVSDIAPNFLRPSPPVETVVKSDEKRTGKFVAEDSWILRDGEAKEVREHPTPERFTPQLAAAYVGSSSAPRKSGPVSMTDSEWKRRVDEARIVSGRELNMDQLSVSFPGLGDHQQLALNNLKTEILNQPSLTDEAARAKILKRVAEIMGIQLTKDLPVVEVHNDGLADEHHETNWCVGSAAPPKWNDELSTAGFVTDSGTIVVDETFEGHFQALLERFKVHLAQQELEARLRKIAKHLADGCDARKVIYHATQAEYKHLHPSIVV